MQAKYNEFCQVGNYVTISLEVVYLYIEILNILAMRLHLFDRAEL